MELLALVRKFRSIEIKAGKRARFRAVSHAEEDFAHFLLGLSEMDVAVAPLCKHTSKPPFQGAPQRFSQLRPLVQEVLTSVYPPRVRAREHSPRESRDYFAENPAVMFAFCNPAHPAV